jgi:hypothetical protein
MRMIGMKAFAEALIARVQLCPFQPSKVNRPHTGHRHSQAPTAIVPDISNRQYCLFYLQRQALTR